MSYPIRVEGVQQSLDAFFAHENSLRGSLDSVREALMRRFEEDDKRRGVPYLQPTKVVSDDFIIEYAEAARFVDGEVEATDDVLDGLSWGDEGEEVESGELEGESVEGESGELASASDAVRPSPITLDNLGFYVPDDHVSDDDGLYQPTLDDDPGVDPFEGKPAFSVSPGVDGFDDWSTLYDALSAGEAVSGGVGVREEELESEEAPAEPHRIADLPDKFKHLTSDADGFDDWVAYRKARIAARRRRALKNAKPMTPERRPAEEMRPVSPGRKQGAQKRPTVKTPIETPRESRPTRPEPQIQRPHTTPSGDVTDSLFGDDFSPEGKTRSTPKPTPVSPKKRVDPRPAPISTTTPDTYRTLRDLVKHNPGCSVGFAARHFPKSEIQKNITLGRVYLRNGKLGI